MTEEVGGVEKRFLERFGNVVRWNGPFGVHLACHPPHVSTLLIETIGAGVQEDRL